MSGPAKENVHSMFKEDILLNEQETEPNKDEST